MNEKVNIAELLKDCPNGMELDCPLFDGLVLEGVEGDDSEYPIRVKTKEGEIWSVTSYGCWDNTQSAKCIIFPKGKTTWEGFVPPCDFKDGDVIYLKTKLFEWISIFKNCIENGITTYADYCLSDRIFYGNNDVATLLCENERICDKRLATEEEKKEFFNELAANGYVWDAESKTLTHYECVKLGDFNDGDLLYVKTAKGIEIIFAYRKTYDDKYLRKYVSVVKQTGMLLVNLDAVCEINHIENIRLATDAENGEFFSVCDKNGYKWDCENKTLKKKTDTEQQRSGHKFDIGTLKPFDKVLVRDGKGLWRPCLFGADMIAGYRYFTSGGDYKECVPYEGNEHLVGTTKDCDDYYKAWTD